ncbi:virulence-related protein [Lachnospiraceae bacterium TWA4]|nr:virulence-related protein [Lachnospiraceae bacterium TWA4]
MTIKFNRTGEERKALVKAIGEILEVKPRYLGTPSMSYEIDYFTVTKDGSLEFDDRADSDEIENLLEELLHRGFEAEPKEIEEDEEEPTEVVDEEPTESEAESTDEETDEKEQVQLGLTVEVPTQQVGVINLTNLLEAKGELIKKAFQLEELLISVDEEMVSFPWFSEILTADEVTAYIKFIQALCKMSKEQKRISSKQAKASNEKYAFRCFLLRLGFIGTEYKMDRKILLQNLEGSSAFKSGKRKEKVSEEMSE